MSRVLITVGTTPFARLVEFFDRDCPGHELTIQTADPETLAQRHRSFAFVSDIAKWYDWADLVVTHAGAGTVFSLLESRKRMTVVPNLDRTDTHQADLAAWLREEHYAFVVPVLSSFQSPSELIRTALQFEQQPYKKRPFIAAGPLLRLLHFNEPLPPG